MSSTVSSARRRAVWTAAVFWSVEARKRRKDEGNGLLGYL